MLKKSLLLTVLSALLLCASICLADVSLPDALKDIPLVPGSKVVQAMTMEQGATAMVEVESTIPAVLEFYKKVFTDKGWKKVMEAEQEDGGALQFMKDNAVFMVTLSKDENRIAYALHLGNQ